MATNTTATTQNHNGNGSTATFAISFSFLENTEVDVRVGGVLKTLGTHYNISGSSVTFTSGNIPPSGTANIKFTRDTNITTKKVDFADGSVLTETDLDSNSDQILFAQQEVINDYVKRDGSQTITGNLVFEGTTDDNNETTLAITDPTADRTITVPDRSGTIITSGDTGTVTSTMIADGTIVTGDIADGTIVNADINASAGIAGTKVTPAFGSQNLSTTGTAATGALSVTGNIGVSGTVDGRDVAADGTKLDGIEAGATADQTAAEIRTLVESASDSNVFTDADHTKLNGIETGATGDQTNAEIRAAVEAASDSNVFTDADHTKLNGIEASADVTDATNVNAAGAVMNTDTSTAAMQFVLDEDSFASNSNTKIPTQQSTKAYIAATSQPLDGELTTLSNMQSGTASKLADSTALTSDIADLNQLDGMARQTTITDDDTKFPTSGAIVDYVAAQLAPIGGFEAVTNENSFPNTQPQSGVVISIADAGGLAVSNTGTASGQTVGGTTVNISGIATNFRGATVAAGIRFLVSSTGSGQNYTYHKATLKEDDLVSLSGDINDFSERYRVGSTNPTTSLDSGDLFFNTSTGKLLVYNGTNSAWEEAQSIGNFFISTLSPAFNGSTTDFTITNAPTNAEQILLIIEGVVQKPNSGTSTPSEGFALSGSTVKLAAAPATGASYHAVIIGSTVNIGTPSNNTVSTAILQNASVTTDKIANEAVTLAKLPHGTSSNNGKFLRANNGADPSFETVAAATGNANVIQTTDGSGAFTASNTFTISGDVFTGHDISLARDSSNAEPVVGASGGSANVTFRTNQNNASGAGVASILDVNGLQMGRMTQYVKLAAPTDQSGQASYTFTFPPISGTNGQALTTNGSGTTSWTSINTDLVNDTSPQLGGDLDLNSNDITGGGNLDLTDSGIIKLGTGDDLQVYHNGSGSFIDAYTNNLQIRNDGSEVMAAFNRNSGVDLYFNNSKKAETVSGGFTVTGTCTATAFSGDGSGLSGIASFPSGTAMLFAQASAPTGWTKSTSHNNKALRVVSGSGGGSGGSNGFTTAFNSNRGTSGGSVHGHTLSTAQIPSHNHSSPSVGVSFKVRGAYSGDQTYTRVARQNRYGPSNDVDQSDVTVTVGSIGNTGSNQSHSHGFTNPSLNLNVAYVDVIIANKD